MVYKLIPAIDCLRITGLDPASPYHSFNDTQTRLSADDAHFVDVLHSDNTSILGFPMSETNSQSCFYVHFYSKNLRSVIPSLQ